MEFDFDQQVINKSDKELLDIYKNSNQYQDDFIELVEKELERREIDFATPKLRQEKRNQILDDLADKPKAGNPVYLFLAFVSALLGGFLGIIAGYIYSCSKETSLTGKRFYRYDSTTRDLGWVMMIIGVLVFVGTLLSRILTIK